MSEGLSYDEASLLAQLSALSTWQRAAFAAACAQRLGPAFRRYAEAEGLDAERAGVIEAALDMLWQALHGRPADTQRLSSTAQDCAAAVPEEEDWNEWAALAEDAAAATSYALEAWISGDPQQAVWAARCGYNATDTIVGARLDSPVFDAGVERRLRQSETVQRELRNQVVDLRTVTGSHDGDSTTVSALRSRATEQAGRLVEDAAVGKS